MASNYAERLQKLEELLASRINQPLAYLWQQSGESREQTCVRAGFDPSQIDRIKFVRWLTPEEAGINPPSYSWDQLNKPSPPQDEPKPQDPVEDPVELPVLETETQYQERLERERRRLQAEKLAEANYRFARSIA
jgi:hypothetical protein